jgi:hypothetical protein
MTLQALQEWITIVSHHLPHLSRPQATILALWSFGMVMTRSCGLTTVADFLSPILHVKPATLRERLRDEYREATAKKGAQRRTLLHQTCFVPLLRWILAWWHSERRLALVLDATTLSDRLVVLAISVAYRGCAVPVAWRILPAHQRGSWRPHWQSLLYRVAEAVPADWFVLVLADRGLYAPWLYRTIQQIGWHPFLRIHSQGHFRLPHRPYQPLRTLLSQPGVSWKGEVICFQQAPLACTLLVVWNAGYEPWLIVTDLPPDVADAAWYGLRAWIEGGFKDIKRGGWHWHQTRITAPDRAERFWLAIALATLWAVSVGGEAEQTQPVSGLEHLPETHIARQRATRRSRPRLLSCFRRGIQVILAAVLTGGALPLGRFYAEPWPSFSLNPCGP